ncbi:hypothetical protein [Mycolicibacterium pyrenivorans]|uniref:hypothetical protein n=1 Tax=Mycolicibacterium pyrenivorans TaxID=187102 RepID=UPI0021F2F87D|nr:hypothetical protein [Mycolicibacterium pyrenivorans]MCV7152093.1 hypothetical protein [Mycolicibacterium pyrenivorans]
MTRRTVLIAARAHAAISGELEALRHRVAKSFPLQRYVPRTARLASATRKVLR